MPKQSPPKVYSHQLKSMVCGGSQPSWRHQKYRFQCLTAKVGLIKGSYGVYMLGFFVGGWDRALFAFGGSDSGNIGKETFLCHANVEPVIVEPGHEEEMGDGQDNWRS